MPARILLTGFEPFGPHAVNPSEAVVRRLAAAPPEGVDLVPLVLPVAWKRAFAPVRRAVAEGRPDAVLLLGLAAPRRHLEFERFALNWRAAPDPDEDGIADDGSPIDPAGPAACLVTIPIDDLVAACAATGAPCRASNHAGTFLCNQVLYQTLRLCDRECPGAAPPRRDGHGPQAQRAESEEVNNFLGQCRGPTCRVGFLHLPPFGDGKEPAGVPEEAQVRAVAAALRALAKIPRSRGPGDGARGSRVQRGRNGAGRPRPLPRGRARPSVRGGGAR